MPVLRSAPNQFRLEIDNGPPSLNALAHKAMWFRRSSSSPQHRIMTLGMMNFPPIGEFPQAQMGGQRMKFASIGLGILTAIQKLEQKGDIGCSFWTDMRAISLRSSYNIATTMK
jgi:hypothetical protein